MKHFLIRIDLEQPVNSKSAYKKYNFFKNFSHDKTRCRNSLHALLVSTCPASTDKHRVTDLSADEKMQCPTQRDANKMKSLLSSPTRPSSPVYCRRWDCTDKLLPTVVVGAFSYRCVSLHLGACLLLHCLSVFLSVFSSPVPDMTYNVFGRTLSLPQSISLFFLLMLGTNVTYECGGNVEPSINFTRSNHRTDK